MFNKDKKIKELENKISELEKKILQEYDIRKIAKGIVEIEKANLRDTYELRMNAREEAWEGVVDRIEDIVEQRLPSFIEREVKNIQDKLLVELARKAMDMEDK